MGMDLGFGVWVLVLYARCVVTYTRLRVSGTHPSSVCLLQTNARAHPPWEDFRINGSLGKHNSINFSWSAPERVPISLST
jgi:hypothetical protein